MAVATAGVAYLTFETGRVPWVALAVASSFGVYGLIRKVAKVDALPGLAIEMILLAPFAVGYLIWCEAQRHRLTRSCERPKLADALLVLSCVVTATPLALFAYGARLLPYSTVGILQYIAPSLQLLCAVFILGEPFQHARAGGVCADLGGAGDLCDRRDHAFPASRARDLIFEYHSLRPFRGER